MRAAAAGITLVLILNGCETLGHRAARGAVQGLQERESEVATLERRLADSLAVYLGERIEAEVLDRTRGTWSKMREEMITGIDTSMVVAASSVRSDLNESLQALIRDNMDLLDGRTRLMADSLSAQLASALTRQATQLLAAAADTVGFRAMAGVRRGLEDEVNPALANTLDELRQLVREEVRRLILPESGGGGGEASGPSPFELLSAGLALLALAWAGTIHVRHSRALKQIREQRDGVAMS